MGEYHLADTQFNRNAVGAPPLLLKGGDIPLDVQGPYLLRRSGKRLFQPLHGVGVNPPRGFSNIPFMLHLPLVRDLWEVAPTLFLLLVFQDFSVHLPAALSPEWHPLAVDGPDCLEEPVRPTIILAFLRHLLSSLLNQEVCAIL